MNEIAPVPPRCTQPLEAFAVEDVERVAKRGCGAVVVREPPARLRAAAVGVHVLDLHALVQPVLAVRAPEARGLRAAPRRLPGAERVAEVVDPDHPRLETACDAVGARRIARPDARAEAEA